MNINNYLEILKILKPYQAQLIAVSKNQTTEAITSLYQAGQRIFAENRVQSLLERKNQLPSTIEWHLIGKLQKNKVKKIVEWISMIHSVDSFELAEAIHKEASQYHRVIPILLEIKIGTEPEKHGFEYSKLIDSLKSDPWTNLNGIQINGLMGMASFTENTDQIRSEFRNLKSYFESIKTLYPQFTCFNQLSMGMSSDYKIALEEGSTMVRIGSKLFN